MDVQSPGFVLVDYLVWWASHVYNYAKYVFIQSYMDTNNCNLLRFRVFV